MKVRGHVKQEIIIPDEVCFPDGDVVYILSENEYNGLMETAYLLSSQANRTHIQSALEEKKTASFSSRAELEDALDL